MYPGRIRIPEVAVAVAVVVGEGRRRVRKKRRRGRERKRESVKKRRVVVGLVVVFMVAWWVSLSCGLTVVANETETDVGSGYLERETERGSLMKEGSQL